MTRISIMIGLAGCVDELDVDVYTALPPFQSACQFIGAASLRVDVEPLDGDPFTVTAAPCLPQLAGQDISGFHVQLQELTAGYSRMTATIDDGDGSTIGAISLPFSPKHVLAIPFDRPDLPNWPTAKLAVSLTGCTGEAHLSATPALAAKPSIEVMLACDAPAEIVAPRGPLTLAVTADCAAAMNQIQVIDDDTVALTLTRTCP